MYLIAVLTAIISAFSPFWGLIFILAYGWKYQQNRQILYLILVISTALLLLTDTIDLYSAVDILLGVGLTSFLFFQILFSKHDYLKAVLTGFVFNVLYAVFRFFFFRKIQLDYFTEIIEEYKRLFEQNVQHTTEQLNMFNNIADQIKVVFERYYVSIWVVMITIAIYLGALIISKKMMIKWQHRKIRLPYFFVYFVILGLIFFLIPSLKVAGGNILLILLPIFLIQGSSILDYFWGEYFKRSKFLLFLLIISIVLNYYILLLVVLIGLVDMWFNIRKLAITEE